MRLSVLDQSPVPEGATGAGALANTLDLARLADGLGFHRYWLAEHHGGPSLAGPSPEALIGPVAAERDLGGAARAGLRLRRLHQPGRRTGRGAVPRGLPGLRAARDAARRRRRMGDLRRHGRGGAAARG